LHRTERYRAKHPERVKERRRRYCAENREQIRATQRRYNAKHRKRIRARQRRYRAKNRDRINAQTRCRNAKRRPIAAPILCQRCGASIARVRGPKPKWCAECKPIVKREYAQGYQAEHREEHKVYMRRYQAENRDCLNAQQRRYRAKNRKRLRVQKRGYHSENRERINAWMRRHRDENWERINAHQRAFGAFLRVLEEIGDPDASKRGRTDYERYHDQRAMYLAAIEKFGADFVCDAFEEFKQELEKEEEQ